MGEKAPDGTDEDDHHRHPDTPAEEDRLQDVVEHSDEQAPDQENNGGECIRCREDVDYGADQDGGRADLDYGEQQANEC